MGQTTMIKILPSYKYWYIGYNESHFPPTLINAADFQIVGEKFMFEDEFFYHVYSASECVGFILPACFVVQL